MEGSYWVIILIDGTTENLSSGIEIQNSPMTNFLHFLMLCVFSALEKYESDKAGVP